MKKSGIIIRILMSIALLYGLLRVYHYLGHELVVAQQNDYSPDQITEEVIQAAFYAIILVIGYFGVVWILEGFVRLFEPAIQGKCPSCGRPYRLPEKYCPECGTKLPVPGAPRESGVRAIDAPETASSAENAGEASSAAAKADEQYPLE